MSSLTSNRFPPLSSAGRGAASGSTVAISDLSKDYVLDGRARRVLDGISVTVRAGEFISIVGPSGCGKSTLLRLIVGLDTAYDGGIAVDGNPVHGPSIDRGLVFQDHRLFPWLTIRRNVELAASTLPLSPADRKRKADDRLRLVGLAEYGDAWPHQLSGGMAQRAALARALMNEPSLLTLDEPLGALDALSRSRMQEELQKIRGETKATMIMVTHDVEEAVFLSDRVIVMDANPGRIKTIVEIDIAHPRSRTSSELQLRRGAILQLLGEEALPTAATVVVPLTKTFGGE